MERVALLIEETGERLDCMLNPESLVMRRHAGVRPRAARFESIGAGRSSDEPLLFTGGGWTEFQLDLLFDTSLSSAGRPDAGEPAEPVDVRRITGRFWDLAENTESREPHGFLNPAIVRFVWGKTWNIPAVVLDVAERLERFSRSGAPGRSWLRMRLRRIEEPETSTSPSDVDPELLPEAEVSQEELRVHEVMGDGSRADMTEEGPPDQNREHLHDLSYRYYGNPLMWRLIAHFNGIDDPLSVRPGESLRIPPGSSTGTQGRRTRE